MGAGLLGGTRPPASERAEVIRLLKQLEHDLNEHSRLLPWLERPSITNRMLGLPAGVRVCIFELDGVLTMSSEVHATAWAETFDRFLLEQAHSHQRPYIPFDTAARLRGPRRRASASRGRPVVPRQPRHHPSRGELGRPAGHPHRARARESQEPDPPAAPDAGRRRRLLGVSFLPRSRADGRTPAGGGVAEREHCVDPPSTPASRGSSTRRSTDPRWRRSIFARSRRRTRLPPPAGCSRSTRRRQPPSRRRPPASQPPAPPGSGSSSPCTATGTGTCYGRARRTSSSAT